MEAKQHSATPKVSLHLPTQTLHTGKSLITMGLQSSLISLKPFPSSPDTGDVRVIGLLHTWKIRFAIMNPSKLSNPPVAVFARCFFVWKILCQKCAIRKAPS